VTEQEFETLLAIGHETEGVEFKGRGRRTNSELMASTIRAMPGMANRRDGGVVILGVDSATLEVDGFEEDEAKNWLVYDELAASVNEYATPSITFDVDALSVRETKIIIIQVHGFEDVPILCRRDFQGQRKGKSVLRRGACYVRSRHKPETAEIRSEEEMRELLDLAIDKGVRKFVTRAQRAGLFQPVQEQPAPPSAEALFERQIEDME
jgi:predicted HTH transcriptional regulator